MQELPPTPKWIVDEFYSMQTRVKKLNKPIKMLKEIYRFVDLYLEACGINKLSICQSGCADCCRIKVDVNELEAFHIARYAEVDMQPVTEDKPFTAGPYCPFVDDVTKSCTVYPVRPFACRIFHTMDDVKFCWPPDQSHWVFSLPKDGSTNHMMLVVAGMIEQINHFAKGKGPFDIRSWFK